MKISYNWLKWYIPEAPDAKKLADIITYHLAEVETVDELANGDYILDVKILPNRGHDLLSHQGMAREIASLLNINFVDPAPKYKVPESKPTSLKVNVKTDACKRYMGRVIRNVTLGPSPDWMKIHLESIGQRSINNIVDATNIVMFDCGEPTHVFDFNKIKGSLVARQAKEGEKLTTLDGKEVVFTEKDFVVADEQNALIIGGVKGGKAAESDEKTKDIVLEVGNFDATIVRKTSTRINIRTEGSKRWENGVSPELAPYGMLELSALIAEMCPEAIFEDVVDIYPKKQEVRKLSFSIQRMSSILGVAVLVDEVKDILKRYNIEYRPLPNLPLNKEEEQGGGFEITVPPMRLDLFIEEDMAEEIGRIIGYDRVKGEIPKINFQPKQNETYAKILFARNKLLNDGYSEIMTTSFRNSGEVSVLASASDKTYLRTNLTDGLKESLKLNQTNAPLLGTDQIKIFEIGTIFKKTGEEMHVAYADKKEMKEETLDEFVAPPLPSGTPPQKGGEESTPRLDKEVVGGGKFKKWPLFPFIARDVAVWVPEGVSSTDVLKVIKENAGDLVIRGPELFDEFKKLAPPELGGGMRISYAFRIVFQSYDRTLTDAEVNDIMTKITNKIKENNGWQVR